MPLRLASGKCAPLIRGPAHAGGTGLSACPVCERDDIFAGREAM